MKVLKPNLAVTAGQPDYAISPPDLECFIRELDQIKYIALGFLLKKTQSEPTVAVPDQNGIPSVNMFRGVPTNESLT